MRRRQRARVRRREFAPALDLGPDEFPYIAEIGRRPQAFDRNAAVAFGMEAIIAGLETLIGSARRPA